MKPIRFPLQKMKIKCNSFTFFGKKEEKTEKIPSDDELRSLCSVFRYNVIDFNSHGRKSVQRRTVASNSNAELVSGWMLLLNGTKAMPKLFVTLFSVRFFFSSHFCFIVQPSKTYGYHFLSITTTTKDRKVFQNTNCSTENWIANEN